MSISKELLSEVLGFEATVTEIYDGVLTYSKHNVEWWDTINIHELANKCKEWAFDRRMKLKSHKDDDYIYVVELRGNVMFPKYNDVLEYFEADTEPEAIFKACEWIMEN